MKIDNFDVLIYKKSDKYTGVLGADREEKSSDILSSIIVAFMIFGIFNKSKSNIPNKHSGKNDNSE